MDTVFKTATCTHIEAVSSPHRPCRSRSRCRCGSAPARPSKCLHPHLESLPILSFFLSALCGVERLWTNETATCIQDTYSDFTSQQERNRQRDDDYFKNRVNSNVKVMAKDPGVERRERARKLKAAKNYLEKARESLLKYEWSVVKELYQNVRISRKHEPH